MDKGDKNGGRLFTLWYSNPNCQVKRGNVKPCDDWTNKELDELLENDAVTVWGQMTAEDILSAAKSVPYNMRGGLDVALGYLDMYL